MSYARRASTCVVAVLVVVIAASEAQNLWCHEGGADRKYSPTSCPSGTTECYKFVCKNAQTGKGSFISRGCGVSSLSSATGLVNESCFQAQDVCEELRGQSHCYMCSNKHMCNSSIPVNFSISLLIASLVGLCVV